MSFAITLWFWQALTPESVGALPDWSGGHATPTRPSAAIMALCAWHAVTAAAGALDALVLVVGLLLVLEL